MTWRFSMIREQLELLTNIRDFSTLFYVNWTPESSKWLESSVESTIWSFDIGLAFHNFLSSNTLSSVRGGCKKDYLTSQFSWFEKTKCFFICDLWCSVFFPSMNRARDHPRTILKDHDAKLEAFPARCREHGIKLNERKIVFNKTIVPYIGYNVCLFLTE